MKYMNMARKYYTPEDGEGNNSGGGASVPDDSETNQEAKYTQAQIDELVSGLKNKNSELLGKIKEQKTAVNEANERLKQFDGIDPDTVRAVLQRFSDDEEAKLISEGKIDEVLNKRTELMQSKHEKELQARDAELEKAKAIAAKFTDRVLADAVRSAGSEAGIHKAAFEDAIYRAKGAFEINSDGEIVAKDGALDAKGQPLTPKAWFDTMKDSAPHWFPAPQGGGMGNKAGSANGLKRSEMSATQKSDYIQKHGQKAYLQLPK